MKNPNSFVALVSAAITAGAEYLIQRYTGHSLNKTWDALLVGAVPSVVLYIGRDGWNTFRKGGLFGLVKLLLNGVKLVAKGNGTSTPAA